MARGLPAELRPSSLNRRAVLHPLSGLLRSVSDWRVMFRPLSAAYSVLPLGQRVMLSRPLSGLLHPTSGLVRDTSLFERLTPPEPLGWRILLFSQACSAGRTF